MNACTRYLTHAMSIIFFDQYFSSLVAKHWTCCSGPGFDSWLKYRSTKNKCSKDPLPKIGLDPLPILPKNCQKADMNDVALMSEQTTTL